MRFPSGVNGKTERVAESGVEAFEKLVALLDYPMFVVTTEANGIAAGCLVGFASQASIHPPRFLVGLSKQNHTFRVAAGATYLSVHVFDREHPNAAGRVGDARFIDPTAGSATCPGLARCTAPHRRRHLNPRAT